mgnify:CR=1 FL=1
MKAWSRRWRAVSFLIDAGFTVLVLCLCPEGRRSAVPAEYAEHAVKWLRERLGENIRTAMTGTSGGALYTLTCACFIPEIVWAAGICRSRHGTSCGREAPERS